MQHSSLLKDWTGDDFNSLEKGVLLAQHRLAETGLFTDERLIEIFDTHPAEHLSVNTMGSDADHFEWREGDRNGVSGEVLLELLKTGHLWVNCRKMLDCQPAYAKVFHAVYDELERGNPAFKAEDRTANLLISSPTALVHYHVDLPVNMLWHLRGTKRVWVYPHFDYRFVAQQVIEKVCSGEYSEDVPYDAAFDNYALVYDVQPGQLLTWPQHAPHRVTNLEGLNVSLSTEHKNPRARRRINVHLANQFLRRNVGWGYQATNVDGPVAHLKQALARTVRIGQKIFAKPEVPYTYPISFKVDPDSPSGYTLLEVDEELLVAPHEAGVV